MRRSEVIPSRQPQMTPAVADSVPTTRTLCNPRCAGLRLGGESPRRAKKASIAFPNKVPAVSETTCPYAAAVSVERPSVTPIVLSIRSPAWIITMLSISPAVCAAVGELRSIAGAQNRGEREWTQPTGFEPATPGGDWISSPTP